MSLFLLPINEEFVSFYSNLYKVISCFGAFSGYKINFAKSEAMPLGSLLTILVTTVSFPFRWSPTGFTYLGIRVSLALTSSLFYGVFVLSVILYFNHAFDRSIVLYFKGCVCVCIFLFLCFAF